MNLRFMLLAIVLCTFLAITVVFGANAARFAGDNQPHMVSIDSRQQSALETGSESATIAQPWSESSAALGFFMAQGLLLETTDYDLQHNSRMARQIEVGADGRVHFVWTYRPLGGPNNQRAVHYRSWTAGGGFEQVIDVSGDVSRTPGGFAALDVFGVKALPVWQYNKTGVGAMTTSAIDFGSGTGSFVVVDPPADVVNWQGLICGPAFIPYIWPVVAADHDAPGNLIVHIAAMEGFVMPGSGAITYFRGNPGGNVFAPGMYGAAGTYIDCATSACYDIAADPNSDKVVIVYSKPRNAPDTYDNDLAYRMSNDLGNTWGPITNITNYVNAAKERAGLECSALFGGDGCLHILWLGVPYDAANNLISEQEVTLYHWSNCVPTCKSLVLEAMNYAPLCKHPAFDYNVSDINLTQCTRTAPYNDVLLYAVYTRYIGNSVFADCSQGGYSNGEVYVSASSTWGETWGAPVNVTNTPTNGCPPGTCAADRFTSSARYTTDQLRIEFMEDLDAGSFVGNDLYTADLMNPVMFLTNPCFSMTSYQIISCVPDRVKYPFHAVRNSSASQSLLLTNGGNQSVNWTASVTYESGGGWLSIPSSGFITAGCTNSATLTMSANSGNTEGLFKATIKFTYDGGSKFLEVPVDFYVFDSWFLPQNIDIRTIASRLNVNQTSQIADDVDGASFSYFADLTKDFINDGSLILGNSAPNLSWKIFSKRQDDPAVWNNYGRLYALSNTTYDSSSFGSYRIASGKGCNRDTTLEFDVTYYAPKHPDSADFYIAHFDLYKGRNNPSGTVSGLTIAYACDWDIPDDSSEADNTAGKDTARQAIWLKGSYSATMENGYGALAAWREDKTAITGGFTWTNQTHVYPLKGYQVDSMWNWLSSTNTYRPLPADINSDQSTVLIVGKNLSIGPTDHLKFDVIIAGKRGETNPDGLAGLEATLDRAKKFICDHVAPSSPLCSGCATCGDANGDAAVDISDAVYLIQFIFSGGTPPGDCGIQYGLGDANGDDVVDISDAVYLIQYIFVGGPCPHCSNQPCW